MGMAIGAKRICLLVSVCALGCGSKAAPPAQVPQPPSESPRAGRVVFPGPPGSDVPPEVAAMLAAGPCTPKLRGELDKHLMLVDDNGTQHKVFLLEPRETICLVGSNMTDLSLSSTPVPTADQPQHLISAQLEQFDFGAVLVLKNHFSQSFEYRALIKRPGSDPEHTSVCSVMANLSGLEHWPDSLELVGIGDFTATADSAPRCR